jgi:hypothetical protein
MIVNGRAGVELPAGAWFSEPVREMTIFAEQYDFAVTLLLLENRSTENRAKTCTTVSRRRRNRARAEPRRSQSWRTLKSKLTAALWGKPEVASSIWDRMRQQRLLPRLRRLCEQHAAVAVGRGDEASGHVVAEQRDGSAALQNSTAYLRI